jgi:hypothetical protein
VKFQTLMSCPQAATANLQNQSCVNACAALLCCSGMEDKQPKRNWPVGGAEMRSMSKRQKRLPAKLVGQDDDWEEVAL